MTGATPIIGYTTPDENDEIDAIATIVAQGFTDVENKRYLNANSKVPTDLIPTYPVGLSIMALSVANAGWPEAGIAVLITAHRIAGDAGVQFWAATSSTNPRVYVRSADSTAWSPWRIVAGPQLPAATMSGTFTFSNAGTARTATVAFPTGRFTSTPNVVATTHDRSGVIAVQGITSTGFTIALGNNGGGSTLSTTQDWFADWIAMQNNF